ncbi:MAG TPA: SLBB domain-containing protein [Planktothrix sp.]|jgi:polysaccharide export outer membrane protein
MHIRHHFLPIIAVAFTLIPAQICLAAEQQPLYPDPNVKLQSISPVIDTAAKTAPPPSTDQERLFKIHAGVTEEYILGPGDVLSITDTTEDKPAVATTPILPDGTTVISYTGVIEAAGHSLREMNEIVNAKAKQWYVNPHIMVNLAKQRPTRIYMLGDIAHPGFYSMSSDGGTNSGDQGSTDGTSDEGGGSITTYGGSNLTVSAAIQNSGGLKETADVRHIRVTRLAPKETFQVDLWKLMIDGDVSEDITLQPGDVVYVPKGGADFNPGDLGKLSLKTTNVRVMGAVKNPGILSMTSDDDILSVIAKAGGWNSGAVTSYVILARTNRDGTIYTEKVSMKTKKALKDPHSEARQKVRAGDVIMVKTSYAKMAGASVGRSLPTLIGSALIYTLINGVVNK